MVDIHPTKTSTGMSPAFSSAAPFYVPYRALGSANVRNLLAAGKQIAGTYVTNAAYRLHPIEWVIGSAAGTAAGMMVRNGMSNADLLDTPTLRQLQTQVRQNSPVHWAAFDANPLPANNGDLVVNNLNPVQAGVPFRVEVYHHRAVRARVFCQGVFLGETTTRANGRLLLAGVTAPAGSQNFLALCYDGAGNLLDTLVLGANNDLAIVDDSDPRFTTTGTWTLGTAQLNKFGSGYRYSWGTDPPSTATWTLFIPNAGLYEVAIWYPEASNRATDSPFTIHHATGQTTIRLNQQINGGKWLVLGQFQFNGSGSERVSLSNSISDTSKLVVGDAVRADPVDSSVPNWREYCRIEGEQ
jgi:hypothetical protein